MRRKLLVLPVLAAGLVGLSHGQPPATPGGPPTMMRFGGGPPDPEMIWGFMSKGQPSINLNDPANARIKDRMVQQGQAVPADGMLTKEQFKANFQASMQKRAAEGGTPGGPAMQFQGGGPGGRGPWGGDPAAQSDDELRQQMRFMGDADGDGRISAAEAANSRLRDQFAQYDTNRDGFLDVAEYRAYRIARNAQRGQDQFQSPGGVPGQPVPPFQPPVPGQPAPPGATPPVPGQPAADEAGRPEVWRYGKLPKEAPGWMLAPSGSNRDGLDADRDGQVGLYEWRRAGKRTGEFVEMDLNGDGYVTFHEWKTHRERQIAQQQAEDPDAAPAAVITPGGPPSAGGDRRGGDRGGRRNPFSDGGKAGKGG